jgi:fructose-bisphosphate aldolase, class II
MSKLSRKLHNTKELEADAIKKKYALGAFNINNMELVQAIVEAAEELQAPLILQASVGARKYAGPDYIIKLAEAALNTSTIPIALHLDHGEDFEVCKSAIDDGFSSVMIDASRFPFKKNIALTKKVVKYAHNHGVSVEAELGKLAGVEDEIAVKNKDVSYTDPDQAAQFIKKTGCDSLAVAIGTSHGAYKFTGKANLDFDRLAEIRKAIGPDFPLILHGASSVYQELVNTCNHFGAKIPGAAGVPDEMLIKSIDYGVAKINTDTDLRLAFTGAIRKHFVESPENFDPRQYLGPAKIAVKELVKHKLEVFRTAKKA